MNALKQTFSESNTSTFDDVGSAFQVHTFSFEQYPLKQIDGRLD